MPGGIRWILFDAVGTLIYADPPVAKVYHAAARRFGSSLAIATIQQRFTAVLREELRTDAVSLDRPPTNEAAERDRWQRIVAAVIDDVASGEELFEQLWLHFAQPQHWRMYDDVAPTLERLRSHGFCLGIASNFDSRLEAIVAAHSALAACDAVFVSSAIGYAKPDPRFFAAVEERLGASPAEIVLVGDDEVNDVRGAAAAGWRAEYLNRG
jgi:putative hydrolase of the HAD superfamily